MSFAKAIDLLELARLASGRVGVSLSEIEARFACVRRTAQRMTDALERVFPDTESYIDLEGHKRWRVPRGKTSEFFAPTSDQLAALEMARTTLSQSGLNQEASHLAGLADTIKLLTPDRKRAGLEADEEALLEAMGHAARPGPRPAADSAVDAVLAEALKGPFEVMIHYRGRRDEAARERRIQPYGILLGSRRYLVAKALDRDDGRLRHFRVEDIESADLTENWFARDEHFDLDAHAAKAFGVYQDDREYAETIWQFSPRAAPHAARFQFHPHQQTEWLDDGSLRVRFTASGHLEMCWHLYAWGDQVEVLAPPALADLVRDYRRDDFPGLP
ncbi:MAG: WYL domain-containing protein [Alphaproteobacteria bacterium]|nr:WYL domain-containing protein [Alphaproteobacteria bacterium]